MRVIAKSTLRDFWVIHKECEEPLKSWYDEAEKSNWISPNEIKYVYPSVSILQGKRLVFNIKGNSYRLVVKINYKFLKGSFYYQLSDIFFRISHFGSIVITY